MNPWSLLRRPALAVALAVGTVGTAAPGWAQSRGELLYNTHCLACHSSQMHWRDKRQAADWPSLRAQVRLWQAGARLNWNDDDVEQVASYLNERFYRYPPPADARVLSQALPAPGR